MKLVDDSTLFRQLLDHSDNTEKSNTLALKTKSGTDLVWMDDIAVVSSDIRIGDNESAKLMVVGPNRMQYDRILSLLDFISKEIEKIYK